MKPGVEPVTCEVSDQYHYHGNITHNLGDMAQHAGLYNPLWRPEDSNLKCARDLIQPLEQGLQQLISDPDEFRKYNPNNGWGNYDQLVIFVIEYLAACRKYPDANIEVWR